MLVHARAQDSASPPIPFSIGRQFDRPQDITRQEEIVGELPLAGALDLLRMSVILTDATAQIVYANHHARALLGDQRLLRISGGRLSAANPKSALRIRQAVRRCTESDAGQALPLGIAVLLLRTDEPSVAAWVLPLRQKSDRGDLRRAAIFIRSTVDLFSDDMFAAMFKATSAELRVLRQLLNGLCIYEISAALNLSLNTVRTHVKSLFAKTGATRQSELLRLASLCIAPVSVGNCGFAPPYDTQLTEGCAPATAVG
jgi:DNA-binding CsgD family transcriptional regulator